MNLSVPHPLRKTQSSKKVTFTDTMQTTQTKGPTSAGAGANVQKPPNCTAEFLHVMLSMQATIKLMHWLTPSYAHHKALDRLYESISDSGDRLAEFLLAQESAAVFVPTVSPLAAAPETLKKPFDNLFSIDTQKNINSMYNRFVEMRKRLPDETAQSIMDEIIAAFKGAMYLCKFP